VINYKNQKQIKGGLTMYKSKSLTKSKFSLGGITMRFAFFKKRNLHSRYRRKPKYL